MQSFHSVSCNITSHLDSSILVMYSGQQLALSSCTMYMYILLSYGSKVCTWHMLVEEGLETRLVSRTSSWHIHLTIAVESPVTYTVKEVSYFNSDSSAGVASVVDWATLNSSTYKKQRATSQELNITTLHQLSAVASINPHACARLVCVFVFHAEAVSVLTDFLSNSGRCTLHTWKIGHSL